MYPCPGGCGLSTTDGNWCGRCTWAAWMAGGKHQYAQLRKSWPFGWCPPASAERYAP